jgi:hypothetical protein
MVAGIVGSSMVNAMLATIESLAPNSSTGNGFSTPGQPGAIGTSAGVMFVSLPALSQKYISPDTTPGEGDSAMLSFSVDHDVNYTVQIDAYYEPIRLPPGVFSIEDGGSYLMDNGTWLVTVIKEIDDYGARDLSLGIGEDPANLTWRNVGLTNLTESIALAASGSKIRIAFAERNGTMTSFPSWIRYFASDDFGQTWTSGMLMNLVSSPGWISGMSMDVAGDNFILVWGFSNTTEYSSIKGSMGTVWESVHTGSAGSPWTTPENLTCFVNNNVLAYSPRITINHTSGEIYLVANTVAVTGFQSVLYDLGTDIDAANWVDNWTLSGLSYTDEPIVNVAFDQADGSFHFMNNTRSWIQGWTKAPYWKGAISALDSFITGSKDNGFRMFANNGPKFFTTGVSTIGGGFRPGILDCEPGFSFKDISGFLNASVVYSMNFDGKDGLGNSHGARYYIVTVDVYNDFVHAGLDSFLILGVDDSIANVQVDLTSPMISPFASPGYQDTARFNITSTKTGVATLFIESPADAVSVTLDMTDGLSTYGFPAVCGDGRTMYLFHELVEGDAEHYVVMYKSQDGGLSWSSPRTIMGTVEKLSYIEAECKGSEIYCYVEDEVRSFLLYSSDSGDSFIKVEIDLAIDAVCADSYVSVWRGASNLTHFNLDRSLDHGYTWEPFLSLPQSGFLALYNILDGVAWDPVSKNYSFILTNGTMSAGSQNATFITATSDGSAFTYWENICDGGHPFLPSYANMMEVDVRYTGANETEWVITNSNYNTVSLTNFSAPLAFCTTSGNGTFSEWGNYTGITGNTMDALAIWWDIAFPANGNPCFVNPYLDFNQPQPKVKQITLYAASTLVYSKATNIQANVPAQMSYVGITGNGDVIPDGDYVWNIVFKDVVGHQVIRSGTLILDNMVPEVEPCPNFTNQTIPIPSVPVYVTIPASDLHLDIAILQYRNSTTTNWVNVTMNEIVINGTSSHFTATIPANTSTEMFWMVVVSDGAGNRRVVDDNGQPFTYRLPNIRIEEQSEPPAELDIGKLGTFTVTFIIPEDAEYVSAVTISYMFDDGSGIHVASMTRLTESLYYYTFTSMPANATSLTYSVTAIDHFGSETPSNRTRQLTVIPPLPAWSISQDQLAPVIVISLIIGVFAGALYSAIIKRKTPLAKAVAEMERKSERSSSAKNISIALSISIGAIGATVALGLASIIIYEFPEGAMLAFMGTFLAAVVLWMLSAARGITTSFEQKKAKLSGTIILYIIGFSIFAALVAVTFIGNEVSWWRVRVNEQAYMVGGIAIPRMMATLMSTFFSSIILLNMSISKGVKRARKELDDAEKLNMNPGWLLKKRDMEISSLMNSVGFKGLIFVAIIGITIIFASDLSSYAPQGLIIILPFIVGVVIMLAIGALVQRGMLRKKDEVIFDKLTACPECHEPTALGSSYCENCGKALISGTRSRPARTCKGCRGLNPEDTKRCRFCGKPLA